MRKWIRFIIARRKIVMVFTAIFTALLMSQLSGLKVIIDPDNILPRNHPFVQTNELIENTFGNKFTVVIALTPQSGDIYQTGFLTKVRAITEAIANSHGAIKSHINGLATNKAKQLLATPEGPLPLPVLDDIPQTPEQFAQLKTALHSDPIYLGLLYSSDEKTTQIIAEYSKIEGGFLAIEESVRSAMAPHLDGTLTAEVGGLPIFLASLERLSQRMAVLFPLALLIIGLIHYEAFRTKQALILPLVTALLAVIWGVGALGLLRQSFDVFNATTPILILAIAAGHAVQILKRYYEEYRHIRATQPQLPLAEANLIAVEEAMTKVGPVMIVACVVAALGFFSLVIFDIKTVRTFGLFSGLGVMSALVIELTFIPALRALLPPPTDLEKDREQQKTIWDRIVTALFAITYKYRRRTYAVAATLLVAFAFAATRVKVDNSQKGYFFDSLQVKKDDALLNQKLAGTNVIYVLVDGAQENAIAQPEIISAIEKTEQFLNRQPQVGKTISINSFLKRMHQAVHGNDPSQYIVPTDPEMLRGFFEAFAEHGEPGEFDSWLSANRQMALIGTFIKTDSSAYIERLTRDLEVFAKTVFPAGVKVSIGGGAVNGVALNEVLIREKILNIAQILLAVFLVSSLVFRSPVAGLLILIPLLVAVIVNFGVMGLFSIPLQIATALVSAMAVGIGADYGIYMSYRMREELRKNNSEESALNQAYLSAGKATLFVSSAVAGGFGVLMISWGFYIHIWMGFLIATAMLTSSIAALTLFPALVLTIRPRFIFEGRSAPSSLNKN